MFGSVWSNSGVWANILVILTSVGSIFFFLKKILVKTIAQDIKELNHKVSPNGKNTQNIGDITARTEDAIKELKLIAEDIKNDGIKTKEILIEHLGWHKGQRDSERHDNVTSSN
jgi:hypothetical protein